MAKRVISFSLSEDIVDFIEKKQKDEKLSNRSVALERIVYIYKFLEEKGMFAGQQNKSEVGPTAITVEHEKKGNGKEQVLDEVETAALGALDDIFNNMPK